MNVTLARPAQSRRSTALCSAVGVTTKSFQGRNGDEHFIAVEAPADLDLAGQIGAIEDRYAQARAALGLAPESAIFRRVFLSDAANQIEPVTASGLARDFDGAPVAVSVIQQPPLPGSKIALLAYHLASPDPIARQRLSPYHVLLEKNGRRHLWTTRLCANGVLDQSEAVTQTRDVFADLIGTLADVGANLRDHCVRTWIYVKDVDVFYHDVVDSRIALFEQQGLTADTHYIASTGIEGACSHQFDVVVLDAYSLPDLAAEQMSFLNDFDHMCPTKDYHVTFERGTRIGYADRAHHFISGTASIDNTGAVLHPGDVMAQLERALENVGAILRSGNAGLDDMMYWIVYLRDPSDHGRVQNYLSRRFPGLPMVIVRGPVCRPEWLIEVEGIAVTRQHAPSLPLF
jgi:enamine deaminase RidA (YjgF/YER057c/UK114 family)